MSQGLDSELNELEKRLDELDKIAEENKGSIVYHLALLYKSIFRIFFEIIKEAKERYKKLEDGVLSKMGIEDYKRWVEAIVYYETPIELILKKQRSAFIDDDGNIEFKKNSPEFLAGYCCGLTQMLQMLQEVKEDE